MFDERSGGGGIASRPGLDAAEAAIVDTMVDDLVADMMRRNQQTRKVAPAAADPYDLPWPIISWSPAWQRMLNIVKASGELVLGTESIIEILTRRWPGGHVRENTAQFLLLSAQDGSPRFGQQLRDIWHTWGQQGRGAHLDVPGKVIGQALFKKEKDLRALMVLGEPALIKVLLGVV